MPPRPSPRLSVAILLIVLVGLLAALAGLLENLATVAIPAALVPYLRFAWPALGAVVLLGIGVAVWQVYRDHRANSSSVARQTGAASASVTLSQANTSSVSSPSLAPASTPPAPAAGSYHTCVLSYATEDRAFAEKLYADLQSAGVSCWFAEQDLKQGDKLREEIYSAINKQDKLLLVLSQQAIESLWVAEEVDAALDREHQQAGTLLLFPIRLDQSVFTTEKYWAITVRQRRIGDFRQWQQETEYQQSLQRLLRDLQV